jgi:hypothetical protein
VSVLRADETPDCPPHFWDLDAKNRGRCRKCGATIDLHQTFAEETAGRQHAVQCRKYPKSGQPQHWRETHHKSTMLTLDVVV